MWILLDRLQSDVEKSVEKRTLASKTFREVAPISEIWQTFVKYPADFR